MWLSKQLFPSNPPSPDISRGQATGCRRGALTIQAEEEHRQASFLGPWGIFSVPIQGADVLSLRLSGESACLGVLQTLPDTLQPGEILLQSAGGASILLKNDGAIVLNGTVIPAVKEDDHGHAAV